MSESHLAYLNLGSNIEPEINLVSAIKLLSDHGDVLGVSTAWESQSVGAVGPNYLNACVLFGSPFDQIELKEQVLRPIEERLGRERNEHKYAPRSIDIDIVLFNGKPLNNNVLGTAYVVVPLAEIFPEYQNPVTHEDITDIAARLCQEVWMEARREVLSQFNGNSFKP